MPLAELESMLDTLEVRDPSSRDIQQLLASINLEISNYGFEVRQVSYKDETYVGYVNKEADACSTKATSYRKDGKPNGAYTAFFGALLEAIALCDAGTGSAAGGVPSVSDQDAYYMPIRVAGGQGDGNGGNERVSNQDNQQTQGGQDGTLKMSLTERQKAMDAFLADGWLSRESDDAIGFGPRTLLELPQVVLAMDDVTEETRTYVNRCLGLV